MYRVALATRHLSEKLFTKLVEGDAVLFMIYPKEIKSVGESRCIVMENLRDVMSPLEKQIIKIIEV